MVPSGFVNIAHRGASAYAPENTFSAFDKALSLGVDQVELDVHFSEDGHLLRAMVDPSLSPSGSWLSPLM